jgi:hypothetical protein
MLPADTPVPLALLIVSLAVTVIVALRYLLTSGLFAYATAKMRPGLYDGKGAQIGREVRWSLLSAGIYGAPAGIVLWGWNHHGWTQMTADWASLPLWYHPLSAGCTGPSGSASPMRSITTAARRPRGPR